MSIRAALTAGTALSAAVTAVWSWTSTLTMGPPPVLHLTTRDLPGDYMQVAAAPTGNAVALFAVVAVIYAAHLLVSGLRARRRARRQAASDLEFTENVEAVPVSGRSWR